jgi:hypothetical protein
MPQILAAILLVLAACAQAQQPADPAPPREPAPAPARDLSAARPRAIAVAQPAWEQELPADLAGARAFALAFGHLFGLAGDGTLLRIGITDGGTTGSLVLLPPEGLPEKREALGFAIDGNSAMLYLALRESADAPARLFRAPLDPMGGVGAFAEIPAAPALRRLDSLLAADGSVLVLGAEDPTAPARVWRHFPERRDRRLWASGPKLPRDRRGAAAFLLKRHLLLAGGTEAADDGTRRAARFTASVRLADEDWPPWTPRTGPLDRDAAAASGALGATSLMLLGDADERHTSVTLSLSMPTADGGATPWRTAAFNAAGRRGATLLHEPGRALALVAGGTLADGTPARTLLALALPAGLARPVPSEEERLAARADEVLKAIRKSQESDRERFRREPGSEEFVLTIIPGDGRAGQEFIANVLGAGRPLSFARNAEVRVLTGAEGQAAASAFATERLPAMILHRRDGTVLSRHYGATLTGRDMFTLTAPMRQPRGS